mmetsp:Transcript_8947/g.7947  ORF Transcript_8947/g.7947 Transcript_8947/m.7947 type:complete len:105 (+) Transcript_8947:254-568(+)
MNKTINPYEKGVRYRSIGRKHKHCFNEYTLKQMKRDEVEQTIRIKNKLKSISPIHKGENTLYTLKSVINHGYNDRMLDYLKNPSRKFNDRVRKGNSRSNHSYDS